MFIGHFAVAFAAKKYAPRTPLVVLLATLLLADLLRPILLLMGWEHVHIDPGNTNFTPLHRPDMPLYPGGPQLGLGPWNSFAGTLAVESAMFAAGVWI